MILLQRHRRSRVFRIPPGVCPSGLKPLQILKKSLRCQATSPAGTNYSNGVAKHQSAMMTNVSKPTIQANTVSILTVDRNNTGQRLDNFLLSHLKGVPKSHVYRIVRRGEVRVNKSRARPGDRLASGDEVRIPPLRFADSQNTGSKPLGERLSKHILFEDHDLLVLNKPSGVAVHGGSGIEGGLVESLRLVRDENEFLELAHRLDKDTSGCLVLAKNRDALLHLHGQFRGDAEYTIEKHYSALLANPWQGGRREVDAPLARHSNTATGHRIRIERNGRAAVSEFSPQRKFKKTVLVDIQLRTGRTHQARAHAAHIGHPVAGDQRYGDPVFNQYLQGKGLYRLFLHAHNVRFLHPSHHTTLSVDAPLPAELREIIDQLQ